MSALMLFSDILLRPDIVKDWLRSDGGCGWIPEMDAPDIYGSGDTEGSIPRLKAEAAWRQLSSSFPNRIWGTREKKVRRGKWNRI